MGYKKNFIVETGGNLEWNSYFLGINRLYDGREVIKRTFLPNINNENDDGSFLVAYQNILSVDEFLEVRYNLGKFREFLNMEVSFFTKKESRLGEIMSELKIFGEIKNGD